MKTTRIILITLASTMIFGSCVSKKKYAESLDSIEEKQQDVAMLEGEVALLENELKNVRASLNDSLAEKELELAEKEQELYLREKGIKELEDLVQQQSDAVAALHQEVCSALKCFTPDELSVEVREGKLYVSMSDKLLFESGSEKVNEQGNEAIGMLSAVLANSDLEIMIEGHTDNVPINTERNKDNWDLSVHRAASVSRLMIENGVGADRIIASGRGEHQPIASNETKKGKQLNRRTEIVLAPRLDKLWKLTEMDYTSQESSGK